MVLIALQVKGAFDGIVELKAPEEWVFTIQQSGGSETRGPVHIRADNEEEIPGSRGVTNFLVSFEGSKKTSYITVEKSNNIAAADAEDDFVTIGEFDCRGAEPVEWHWKETTTFAAVAEDNDEAFEELDFTEGDWYDVTDGGNSVGISDIEYRFEVVKKGKKGGKKRK